MNAAEIIALRAGSVVAYAVLRAAVLVVLDGEICTVDFADYAAGVAAV